MKGFSRPDRRGLIRQHLVWLNEKKNLTVGITSNSLYAKMLTTLNLTNKGHLN